MIVSRADRRRHLLVIDRSAATLRPLPLPRQDLLFLVTLAILMVPYATILIPLYVLLGWLGLQNSLVGLSLVLIMFQLPFGLFMMRNSFEAVPRELEESALVDGCTMFAVLVRVMLPAVRRAWSPSRCSPSSPRGTSSSPR